MILKRKTQNTLALSLTLFILSFLVPNTIKSQTTIPSTTVSGCLKVNQTTSTGNLDVGGSGRIDSSLVVGDTMRAQDVIVTGNARIAGDVNVGGDLVFKNGTGISVTTSSVTNNEIYTYGKSAIGASPSLNPCFNPNAPFVTHQFSNAVQIFDNGPSGYTGGNILTMQSWFNGSSIDVAGGGGLLMNYFCGKDIAMCTGTLGGTIFAGDKFRPSKNVQIGPHWQTLDPTVALDVYLSGTTSGLKLWSGAIPTVKLIHDNYDQFTFWGNGNAHLGQNVQIGFAANSAIQDGNTSLNINNSGFNGIKFNTTSNTAKLISVNNPNLTTSPFTVTGDGKTYIGGEFAANSNYMLTVNGKIGAREIKVSLQNPWPDYVFEKNYELVPLLQVEEFIKNKKHLPGMPSAAELKKETCSLDLAEMLSKHTEKIENIYLYLIEMKKEIEDLKEENSELKKRLK